MGKGNGVCSQAGRKERGDMERIGEFPRERWERGEEELEDECLGQGGLRAAEITQAWA